MKKAFMNEITSADDLPGTRKKSFAMYYNGGMIWFEHLDGMYGFTDAVMDKFRSNPPTMSRPHLVAINLDETTITDKLIELITETYVNAGKMIYRVVFVGLSRTDERRFKKAFKTLNCTFAVAYINDFEKAKEWLINERTGI